MLDAKRFESAILQGDRDVVRMLVSAALETGEDPVRVLHEGLLPAMDVVGQRFGAKTMFISEVLLAARAMHAGLGLLRPLMLKGRDASAPRRGIVLGTVKGDLHDIGKNLVGMMLEAGGFDVVDLGTNVTTERFAQAVREHRPAIVALSALLTTTMRQMRQTLEELRKTGAMDGVKTMIGGAPVTEEFARTIGADAYAADATGAVATAKKLLQVP